MKEESKLCSDLFNIVAFLFFVTVESSVAADILLT